MRYKHRPKPFMIEKLFVAREEVGYIQLVDYFMKDKNQLSVTPHLEYEIKKPEHRNKGLLRKALPKYLKKCAKYDFNQILAVVEKGNQSSIRLLENNNFLKISEADKTIAYVIDLRIKPETAKLIMQSFEARREYNAKMGYDDV